MIKRLIPFAKKYKKAFILAFLCVVGETIFELVIPVLMANIIDIGHKWCSYKWSKTITNSILNNRHITCKSCN